MADKGPDEMYCESCGEVIKKEAEICPHCGVRNASGGGGAGGAATGGQPAGSQSIHSEGMFVFPLKYPTTPGLMPIVIGAVLSLLSFLVLPIVLVYGYLYRIGRAAARGDDVAPEFSDWGGLLKDGALLIVAALPFIAVIGLMWLFIFGIAAILDSPGVTLIFWLLGLLVNLVASYFALGLLPALISTGSVKEAYSGGTFIKMTLTKDFIIGILFYIVLNFVVQTVFTIVISILFFTLIGIIIAIPLYFAMIPYIAYLTGALWGFVVWDSDSPKFPDVPDDAALGLEF